MELKELGVADNAVALYLADCSGLTAELFPLFNLAEVVAGMGMPVPGLRHISDVPDPGLAILSLSKAFLPPSTVIGCNFHPPIFGIEEESLFLILVD